MLSVSTGEPRITPIFQPSPEARANATSPFFQPTLTLSTAASDSAVTHVPPVPNLQILTIDDDPTHRIFAAHWPDDNNILYYGHGTEPRVEQLTWAAYDARTQISKNIPSPLHYDSSVWTQLDAPRPDLCCEPLEVRGLVSPSGQRVIYIASPTNSLLEATYTPDETPQVEVYIGDVPTRQKTKLGEIPAYLTLNEAVWSEDETKVALHLSGATSETYIVDLQTDVITPLQQMSNIQVIESIAPLAVSSDGQTLAAWSDYALWLVNLANGHAIKIDDPVLNAEFSRNGETLYYAWGDQTQNELRSYDVTSSITSTIAGPSREVHFDQFTVSPNGDRIAVWDWGGRLRLIVLNE